MPPVPSATLISALDLRFGIAADFSFWGPISEANWAAPHASIHCAAMLFQRIRSVAYWNPATSPVGLRETGACAALIAPYERPPPPLHPVPFNSPGSA